MGSVRWTRSAARVSSARVSCMGKPNIGYRERRKSKNQRICWVTRPVTDRAGSSPPHADCSVSVDQSSLVMMWN